MSFTVTRAYMRGRLLFIMSGFFLAVTAGAGFISWQASQARNNAAFGAVLDAMSQATGDVIHYALTLDQIRLKGEIVREKARAALRGGDNAGPPVDPQAHQAADPTPSDMQADTAKARERLR